MTIRHLRSAAHAVNNSELVGCGWEMAVVALLILVGCTLGYDTYDVDWVPTPSGSILQALEFARVGPGDLFFELGCGDARVAIAAAQLGAKATCVENEAERVAEATVAIRAAGVESQVTIIRADLFEVDLRTATVVYLYLFPAMNARLLPALSALPLGARVLSREFQVPTWPCGARLALSDSLYLRWEVPLVVPPAAARVDATGAAVEPIPDPHSTSCLMNPHASTCSTSLACDDEAAGSDAVPVVVWCFGDSLTAGLHSCRGTWLEDCSFSPYAPALQTALRGMHRTLYNVEVRHVGYSGWTAEELLRSPRGDASQPDLQYLLHQEAAARAGRPVELAILLAGTNDIGKRRHASHADIVTSIWALHALAHRLGVATLAVGVPPTGFGMGIRNATAWEDVRRSVNDLLRAQCAAAAPLCSYVDCPVQWTPSSRAWEADGVHLSADGYAELGRGVAAAVLDALTPQRQLRRPVAGVESR